jgi:phospholipase C
MALEHIDTFVIVMMENRSFDHVCGYLALPEANYPRKIEGLQTGNDWIHRFDNDDKNGRPISIHRLDPRVQNIIDPPHEDVNIRTQINTPTHGNASPIMGGFVQSYLDATPRPTDFMPVMGYYDQAAVPVFDFFARNFAICDNWFSPLPAGTQINRLMAMSGESHIHHNVSDPFKFPEQKLVYEWLEDVRNQPAPWCSYQWDGLPFFALMPKWWGRMLADHNDPYSMGSFRRYDKFALHWNDPYGVPNVVFIEPKYTDDPAHTLRQPNDDHCPTGVTAGQLFLADIYNTVVSNPERWKSTMLIVTYDEHGGFFDHVAPPKMSTEAGGVTFQTTGIRVPAFIISPYVTPGSVFSEQVDSTSILQLLADKYTPGKDYSPAVAARKALLKPLASILNGSLATAPAKPIPLDSLKALVKGEPTAIAQKGPPSATSQAFQRVWSEMSKHYIS